MVRFVRPAVAASAWRALAIVWLRSSTTTARTALASGRQRPPGAGAHLEDGRLEPIHRCQKINEVLISALASTKAVSASGLRI